MKFKDPIIMIALILCSTIIVSSIIAPKSFSIESIMLALIAAYLGGIHAEIKRNNQKDK